MTSRSKQNRNRKSDFSYGSLEERKMFAVVSIQTINDIPQLVIDGTSGIDEFTVTDHNDDAVFVSGTSQYTEVVDGEEHGFAEAHQQLFNKSDFERIRFLGRSGNDSFTNETDVNSAAFGHNGNDTLRGGNGNNWIQGGNGNDRIYGGDRNDMLRGRAGDDYIEAGKRHDRVFGGDGNDTILGQSGRDFIKGENGSDTIFAGNGDDRVDGGLGNNSISLGNHVDGDTALYDQAFADYDVNEEGLEFLVTGTNRTDRLMEVEELRFSDRTTNADDVSVELSEVEESVLSRLNQLRSSRGLSQLTVATDLTEFGREWFADNDLVHSDSSDRAHLFVGDRSSFGENIGFISTRNISSDQLAETMHDLWFNSTSHRENMLGSGFDEVGIAVVEKTDGWYFMQFFMG